MKNKIISMCDYIKYINNIVPSGKEIISETIRRDYENIVEYAEFLQERWVLGMFIPCDKKNKPLNRPENFTYFQSYSVGALARELGAKPSKKWYNACHKYEQAQDRVIFEGNWEHSRDGRYTNMNWVTDPTTPKIDHHHKNVPLHGRETIEDLVQDNLILKPLKAKELGL